MEKMICDVYTSLKNDTESLTKKLKELEELEKLEKSGIYSLQYVNNHLRPKIFELRREIEQDKRAAVASAKGIVAVYQDKLRDADNLHVEDLTEDAKLFTAGIKLRARDIEAILRRNAGNATMQQIALRYAEENGVDLGRRHYIGHQAEIQEAGGVSRAIDYYSRWVDQPNALAMLDKFFSVEGESGSGEE